MEPAEDRRLSILVVEDDDPVRQQLQDYLEEIAYHRVVALRTAREALERFEPGGFDCAFIDLKLPGMNGLELLAKLKEADPTLAVIIMTAYPSMDAAIDTMRQGASDFLVKPFSLGEIKVTLERVMRERALLRQNLELMRKAQQNRVIERLNRELARRVREQRALREISEAVDQMHTSEELYQAMATLACEFLEARRAAVLLLERVRGVLIVIAVSGLPLKLMGRAVCRVGEGVAGKVASERQPMLGYPDPGDPLCRALGLEASYLCLPVQVRGEMFGVLVVAEKKGAMAFRSEDLFIARFLLQKVALSIENVALYEALVGNLHSLLGALVTAMEAKDPYTRQHSRRVTNFSVLTAQIMGMSLEDVEAIRFAAYLHDIGKIGIKDHILQKPSPLAPHEYEEIKRHPVIGEQIIRPMELSPTERAIVRHHHERFDGTGYPDGLKGEEIPLVARVVCVADSFDAITSDRPYRKGKSLDEAVAELTRCSGTHFDPQVVEAFLEMLKKYDPPRFEREEGSQGHGKQ